MQHHRSRSYPPTSASSIPLGDERYVELGSLIGRGSVSFVHQGVLTNVSSRVKRPVALKLFGTIASDDRDVVESALVRSVRRAACVNHPNVVAVYEFGVYEDCQPFIVSELVVGRTLRALLDKLAQNKRRLPLDLALFIATELAEGLYGAHIARDAREKPIHLVHGELSPRDVLLSFSGEVKISDFELSGARHAASSIRSLKMIAHRSVSLAPEVASGVAADARSDVFSLGLVLREMLIGPRFTRGKSPAGDHEARGKEAEIVALARDGAVDPVTFGPRLPPEISRLLSTSLAVDPALRYEDAGVMASELRRATLALGVGDMRVFLKRELAAEFADELGGAKDPRITPIPPPPRVPDASLEEGFKKRWSVPDFGESQDVIEVSDADMIELRGVAHANEVDEDADTVAEPRRPHQAAPRSRRRK